MGSGRGPGLWRSRTYGKGGANFVSWEVRTVTAFSRVLDDFAAEAPFCVMTRGLLENVFAPAKLDALFERHATEQYHKHLLFSTAADLLCEVILSIRPSVHAAYKAAHKHNRIAVSVTALYDKLAGTEPA